MKFRLPIFLQKPLSAQSSQNDGWQGLRLRWCSGWKNRLHRCCWCDSDHLAKRGNMTLVAVVMNSVNGAWADTKSLLDYGFDNFECKKMKISKNPVPKKNLPSEQYLLNNCGNTYPFYYTKNVYVTSPQEQTSVFLPRNRPFFPTLWDH